MQYDPENTIYAAKRLIGRVRRDPELEKDITHMNWALDVRWDNDGRPAFYGALLALSPEKVIQWGWLDSESPSGLPHIQKPGLVLRTLILMMPTDCNAQLNSHRASPRRSCTPRLKYQQDRYPILVHGTPLPILHVTSLGTARSMDIPV